LDGKDDAWGKMTALALLHLGTTIGGWILAFLCSFLCSSEMAGLPCTGVAQVVLAVAPHFDTTFGLQYFLRVLAISRETLN
jgi:Ni/Fe-hydrogenase subunit HybB-like protein